MARKYQLPTNHLCPCGDEDVPGRVCYTCGKPATEWLSDAEFDKLEPVFPEDKEDK